MKDGFFISISIGLFDRHHQSPRDFRRQCLFDVFGCTPGNKFCRKFRRLSGSAGKEVL